MREFRSAISEYLYDFYTGYLWAIGIVKLNVHSICSTNALTLG